MQTSESAFRSQLEQITEQHPTLIVVGSVGRAAIVGENISPFRPDGTLRDIDVLSTQGSGHEPLGLSEAAGTPHEVDPVYKQWITFRYDTPQLITRYDRSISMPVEHPGVFAANKARVNGVEVQVLNPRTQAYMDQVMGPQRAKDVASHAAFLKAIEGRTDLLPEDFFESFREFIPIVQAQRADERSIKNRAAQRQNVFGLLTKPFKGKKGAA